AFNSSTWRTTSPGTCPLPSKGTRTCTQTTPPRPQPVDAEADAAANTNSDTRTSTKPPGSFTPSASVLAHVDRRQTLSPNSGTQPRKHVVKTRPVRERRVRARAPARPSRPAARVEHLCSGGVEPARGPEPELQPRFASPVG